MKRSIVLLAGMMVVGLIMMGGCCPFRTCGAGAAPAAESSPKLCGGCGQVKGSSKCCVKDAPQCGKCGLAKGSPGCCKS